MKWARYQNYAQQIPIFEILHVSEGILSSVSIFSDIDKVILINPSSYVFVFGDFKIHHKECLIYLVEPIGLTNFVFISSNISQIVNFFNRIPEFDNHNTAIFIELIFAFPTVAFVLQWFSLHWGISSFTTTGCLWPS